MKRLLLLLSVIFVAQIQAQGQWDFNRVYPGRYYIAVYEFGRAANGDLSWEVKGMVKKYVLDSLSMPTIGSGTTSRGFFEFTGESETLYPLDPVFDWPPGLITEDMVYGQRNAFHYIGGFGPGFCNCDCPRRN